MKKKSNIKPREWFLTKQNVGRRITTFDVWDHDPSKVAGWKPNWKVYRVREVRKSK